jgi:hypothetical protein
VCPEVQSREHLPQRPVREQRDVHIQLRQQLDELLGLFAIGLRGEGPLGRLELATPSMDITSFVGKLLEQDNVDALREGVRVLAQAVMEDWTAQATSDNSAGRAKARFRVEPPRGFHLPCRVARTPRRL